MRTEVVQQIPYLFKHRPHTVDVNTKYSIKWPLQIKKYVIDTLNLIKDKHRGNSSARAPQLRWEVKENVSILPI